MPVVPITVKVAFALLALGFLIFIIGFVSPYWGYREIRVKASPNDRRYLEGSHNWGIWTFCQDIERSEYYSQNTRRYEKVMVEDQCWSLLDAKLYLSDEIRATQFFETVGLLAWIASLVLLVLCMCIDSCKDRRILPVLSAVFCLGAAGCIIVGTIIYGAADAYKNHLSWAFALTIVGGIIFAVAGVLIIIGAILKK